MNDRVACSALFLLIALCSVAAAQPPDQVPTITPLRGNLYRAQDGSRVTVFRARS